MVRSCRKLVTKSVSAAATTHAFRRNKIRSDRAAATRAIDNPLSRQHARGVPMLAVLALVCFVLALFDVTLGPLDLVTLGLAFVAAHLAFGIPLSLGKLSRRRR
jgi:hypothetical protein